MCGISGFINYWDKDQSETLLNLMASSLGHRGDEEFGMFSSEKAFLSNSRLSIIDLEFGTQPFLSKCKNFACVFNGEIYNHKELQEELIGTQYSINSNSDSEVLVNYLAFKGVNEGVPKLNGNFAIAFYDLINEDLYLIRDRIGQRPLFYTIVNDTLFFSSEVKSFLNIPEFDFDFDWHQIKTSTVTWSTDQSGTIWNNISQVPFSSIFKWENKKKYSFYKYFDIGKCFEQQKVKTSIKSYKDNFFKALAYRCISDVEIGVYVSGGIDSSAVAAALSESGHKNMRSYSITFDNKEFDESRFQKLCADHFNFKHTSISISEKELINNFKNTLWHTENIMFRTAPIPMFLLSQRVSKDGIKVVITGEGADEFNYGYNVFKEHDLISNWRIISEEEKRKRIELLYPYIFAKDKSKRSKFLAYMYLQYSKGIFYNGHSSRLNKGKKALKIFITKKFDSSQIVDSYYKKMSDCIKFEHKTLLSGYLLSTQGDRVSLANSVENRTPFLDPNFINYLGTIDPNNQFNYSSEKILLRDSFKESLPKELVERPKNPYRSVDSDFLKGWINKNGINNVLSDLNNSVFNDEISLDYLTNLLRKLDKNKLEDESSLNALMIIFSLIELKKIFIDKSYSLQNKPKQILWNKRITV